MHLLFAILAVGCAVLGFVGFAMGGLPTVVFWILTAVFIFAAWKSRPARQRARENREQRHR